MACLVNKYQPKRLFDLSRIRSKDIRKITCLVNIGTMGRREEGRVQEGGGAAVGKEDGTDEGGRGGRENNLVRGREESLYRRRSAEMGQGKGGGH